MNIIFYGIMYGLDIARYVECFVGKGKWILRSSDDGRALLEFGFTGVFATYSFHDDRSTVALFDVQVLSAIIIKKTL